MPTERFAFAMLDIGVGLSFMGVAIPLILRKIGPNALYGFRIPQAFRSEEDWYDINAYGGRQLVYWSAALVVSGVVKLLAPMEDLDGPVGVVIIFGPIIAAAFGPIVVTLIYAISKPPGATQEAPLIPEEKLRVQRVIICAILLAVAGLLLVSAATTSGIRRTDLLIVLLLLALGAAIYSKRKHR